MGIKLPEGLRSGLAEVGRGSTTNARWVDARNLHLTIKFLGQVEEDRVGAVKDVLREIAGRFDRFMFYTGDLGAFPSLRRGRVLWLGVGGEGAAQQDTDAEVKYPMLSQLGEDVDATLSRLGFEREARPFHPHITLARLKTPQDLTALVEMIGRGRFQGFEVPVASVVLFESTLRPRGAEYSILFESLLGQGGEQVSD